MAIRGASGTGVTDGDGERAHTKWQGAKVVSIQPETPSAKSFRLSLPAPSCHLAGQHYVVRLTAPDGYTASRSYSVVFLVLGHEFNEIELTVERLNGGEVSTFLDDVVKVGDEIEVRGPVGGRFVWTHLRVLLVGGGSGTVPLMAMLRLCAARERRISASRLSPCAHPPTCTTRMRCSGRRRRSCSRVAPEGYPR